MASEAKRPLKVFLCHASGDKLPVRDLYKRLTMEGVDAWLDKEKLLPGQDWQVEIPRAVREADVVVVCLSNGSITKEGYVQKEIKSALDIADEKPEGSIFLIPARLEDCPVPERLSRWQWVDLYEENGFVQLLRSLKLRARVVGAVIEAASYDDTDKDRERRVNQLYTEGLEAFYTEDWDKACRRFQTILSEQPNHKNAREKLEEAENQRQYAKLYSEATEACRSENWTGAISALEELSKKTPNHKDTVQLLRDARKRKQLTDLYAEAIALHAAQKWKAVIKVFEQISIIEPNYPDSDGLLSSAQIELAEAKRLSDLNEQYSHALREMDAGNWYESRRLLELVHKSQIGFLETEKLLRKVENEISKEEEKRRQNEEMNVLYEQAHGLLRSKKWRNALEKMDEIHKLDLHFPDIDGIIEKAQKELDREAQEAERQNKMAALYAESVRLLKEEKYQEALEKWQEVRAIDPKYPDRQGVERYARKRLAEAGKSPKNVPRIVKGKAVWFSVVGILIIAFLGVAFILTTNHGEKFNNSPIFRDPTIDGYRLDWCNTDPDCGEAAATAYCKLKGYTGLVSFQGDFSGKVAKTKLIGSGDICSGNCDSFEFITCYRESSRLGNLATVIAPTPFTSFRWDFSKSTDGWDERHDLSVPQFSQGWMIFNSTGNDPQVISPALKFSASATPVITVRMRVVQSLGSEGQIYFVTDKNTFWDEDKKVSFFVGKDDGAYKTYDIPMSVNPHWKDEITQIRLDPTNEPNAEILIDSVSIHSP